MDRIDYKILRELQANGRLTNQELADRVNLSPSPCLRRLRNLEASGVIRGYAAIVDQKLYGLPVTVFVRIHLERHSAESVGIFENAVRGIDEILECHLLTGNVDYQLRVVVDSLEAYERFMRDKIHKIPGIASIDSSFAYGEIKRSLVYPMME
ncbi:MAG: Lrp/AsnC family transcriptional regulator [Hyphomicrobiales bacterium]|nr:Lrp/AsnC family transcriptional regulator [Hyphomicrobiales bacterium]